VTETQRLEPPTEDFAGLYRPTPPPPPPRPAKPPVDWGRRCKAALFALICLVIVNVAAADYLFARHILGWH
jgi:hypothetical protein